MTVSMLEEEYKDIKEGIHLQSQMKRSKDALICWFSEFFYEEIQDPKANILSRLVSIQNNILEKEFQNFIMKSSLASHKNTEYKTNTQNNENILQKEIENEFK